MSSKKELEYTKIKDKIKIAVFNPTTIHFLDEQRITRLFYEVRNAGKLELYDLYNIINSLGPYYREYTKDRMIEIADKIYGKKRIRLM